ncbi:MAG: hypothetical protein FJ031_12975 [Chloroflexi bacterium]|nr:hypothetical protein [Chloroflexota bacterium]
MSYQEKNITVSLFSHVLILGFYLVKLFQMVQSGGLVANSLFSLWAIVIVSTILVNIFASILTNIILSIVHAIRTRSSEEEQFISDERDNLIGLKGMRISYITFSIGVLIAMLTFVFGQPPLVMFAVIVFFSITAEILGDAAQVYLYRRGF